MSEILMVKDSANTWRPCSQHDLDLAKKFKIGQAAKFKTVKVKDRALKFHQKYWAGLITLTFDYWEPKGGVISVSEVTVIKNFAKHLDKAGGSTGLIYAEAKDYINKLIESRAQKYESPTKTKEGLHAWIKEQAGLYDLIVTPFGVRKELKSINFNSMNEEQFDIFYKEAFSVCWKFILSRSFNDAYQADEAINRLIQLEN